MSKTTEPTTRQLLAAITALTEDVINITDSIKDLRYEMKIGFLEARASLAEFRISTEAQFRDVHTRQDTLFAAVADLRAEYNNHIHEDPAA